MADKKKKIATALKYEPKNKKAPALVAKGKGVVAENIEKVAKDHKVPTYEDEKLSNQLYHLSIGDEIPPEMYQIVAKVLAFISQLDQKY